MIQTEKARADFSLSLCIGTGLWFFSLNSKSTIEYFISHRWCLIVFILLILERCSRLIILRRWRLWLFIFDKVLLRAIGFSTKGA
tara:strand:- start:146 stop:400 length:255 start_codon:yes stop_codon:yes gene_type:complete